MRKGSILPIALMAFAIVAFLFVVTYAVTPGLKYPWSTNTAAQTAVTNVTTNNSATSNVNTVANTNTAIDLTADWKTYTNSSYGAVGSQYSFRYPKDWTINDFDPQYVRLSPANQTTNETTTPTTISIDYIVVSSEVPVQKIAYPSTVRIGDTTSTQGLNKGTPDVYYAQVALEQGVLQISWVKNESSDSIHHQILSTFTFTSTATRVTLVNSKTNSPISQTSVSLYSDNGVRCVTEPCSTNGRSWTGTTDTNGSVTVPASMVDESMTFTLDGYNGKELHSGTQQADQSWKLSLTKK